MKRVVLFIIFFSCLLISVADYYGAMRSSYNKYLSGEYFFREKAYTIQSGDPDAWLYEAAFTQKDYSDPKEVLLHSSDVTVYVCDPKDGACTVIYGENEISDFPLYALKLDSEDTGYFYGTKQYTFKEYIDYLKSLSGEQVDSPMVSDRDMVNFKHKIKSVIILAAVDAAILIVLFMLFRHELDVAFDRVLLIGVLYSVFFSLISSFMI